MIIAEPVIVSLEQLSLGVEDQILENAFGPDSLGIIVVEGLSGKFSELRERVLSSASVLANLPSDQLEKLESEESTWLTGWSRGKEKLANSGLPDNLKGSFYVNCAFHKDDTLEGPTKELVSKFDDNFKAYTTPNLWPAEREISELKDFQADLKKLCSFIIDVAQLVASNCDKYIGQKVDGYEKNYLERVVRDSTCTKARLLHYYPTEGEIVESGSDSWCGEHLDHSCLTGLTSAIFIDESKGLTHKLEQSPDKEAGLYIRNRNAQIVKVNIPKHCLAFQSGSTLQEVSNGSFKAVSHFVKGTNMNHIARNTLAVFCQPDLDEMVNAKENFGEYANRILGGNH
ncbi:hypothetical protein CLIB1423_11S02212 [[Candida] railenensis]|uniref:Clavaminate synthase-like protein n=1 Tax=[Candida] railenensis TaxID=45579 RepID=A0A9P0VZH6_9ASCO|nr:hypothetical protein CLIB1423_11S02212 [[Candida] railenensis]